MQEHLEEVLSLQPQFSPDNTPAMQRRGALVRTEIPEWLRTYEQKLRGSFGGFRGRLAVQGKDGTGLKTWVPWVRIYTPELSPSPQDGWYVVYLFRPDGEGVALCLSHGSTKWDGMSFKPRSPEEAARLMVWSRGLVGAGAAAASMSPGIDLGSDRGLARPYEATTAFSKMYRRGAVPDANQLLSDCAQAVDLLGQLYRETTLGRAPDVPAPEIVEAVQAAENASRPNAGRASRRGQGRGLTAEQRALVENHAMRQAEAWLTGNGYDWRDVHRTESFDYAASKDGIDYVVEVKGTTGALGAILLTDNEVQLHQRQHPRNILVVVHGIELLDERLKAVGGTTTAFNPWKLDPAQLKPLSYQYSLAST